MDQDGDVIDILVQSRRNRWAATRLFRKLLKGQGREPRRLITDKLRSYAAAHRMVMPSVIHSTQLDAMFRAHWPDMQRGKIPAINAGLKIIERRVRLLGLDREPRARVAEVLSTSRRYQHLSDDELMKERNKLRSLLLTTLPEQEAAAVRAALAPTGRLSPRVTSLGREK